uniref:Uncharacterized protein n=1 Tax=Oryza meridionalis TaxID=40149 RepID=A0A0E0EAA6_9ORYZ
MKFAQQINKTYQQDCLDMIARQSKGLVFLLPPHLHHRVDQVLLHPGAEPLRLEVLVDHRVEETVDAVVYRTISLMQRWRIMLKGDMLVMPNKWMEEVMIKPLHLKLINLPEAF